MLLVPVHSESYPHLLNSLIGREVVHLAENETERHDSGDISLRTLETGSEHSAIG